MNRVLQFLHPFCPSCNQLRHIEAVLAIATAEAERIELLIGNKDIEFWIPDAARVLKPKPDDVDDDDIDATGIRLILAVEPRLATIDEDLAKFTVAELRRIAGVLASAADAVEAGTAGGVEGGVQ